MRPVAPTFTDPARRASPAAVHAMLAALISRSAGTRHAAMLTQPVMGADGRTDWCTGLPGEIVPAAALTDPAQTELRQSAGALLADLRRLQARLNAEGPASRATARLLAQAIDVDLSTTLHAVGGEPVLAPWGAALPAPAESASAPPPPAPATAPTPVLAPDTASPIADSLPSARPAAPPRRRSGVHAIASVLLLLVGGGALAAALHARAPDPATVARTDALTRQNAELGQAAERARTEACRRPS